MDRTGKHRQIIAAVTGEYRIIECKSAALHQEFDGMSFGGIGWQHIKQADAGRLINTSDQTCPYTGCIQARLHLCDKFPVIGVQGNIETEFMDILFIQLLQP